MAFDDFTMVEHVCDAIVGAVREELHPHQEWRSEARMERGWGTFNENTIEMKKIVRQIEEFLPLLHHPLYGKVHRWEEFKQEVANILAENLLDEETGIELNDLQSKIKIQEDEIKKKEDELTQEKKYLQQLKTVQQNHK